MAEVDATIAALDALAARVRDATRDSVADALHLIQAKVMGFAPVGVSGNSTNSPGDLRRSIDVEGPAETGDSSWAGRVGPTTNYGRQRELGGHIYPRTAKVLAFTKFGERIYTRHVYQHPNPYTKRGREAAMADIEAVLSERLTVALGG